MNRGQLSQKVEITNDQITEEVSVNSTHLSITHLDCTDKMLRTYSTFLSHESVNRRNKIENIMRGELGIMSCAGELYSDILKNLSTCNELHLLRGRSGAELS